MTHLNQKRPIITTTGEYSQNEDSTVLQAVVELQENVPKFCKPAAAEVLEMGLLLGANEEIEEDVRAMAVELCVTIGESLPGAIRKKVPKAISDLCLVCLKMMEEIDEDEEWGQKTVPEDDDEDLPQLTVVGESSLDRIARSLGGQTVLKGTDTNESKSSVISSTTVETINRCRISTILICISLQSNCSTYCRITKIQFYLATKACRTFSPICYCRGYC